MKRLITIVILGIILLLSFADYGLTQEKKLGDGAEVSLNKLCQMSEGDLKYYTTKDSTVIMVSPEFWKAAPTKSKVHLIMLGMLYTIETNRKNGLKVDQLFIHDKNTKKVLVRGHIPNGSKLGDIEYFK
jgi:hypothetical protein